MPGENSSRSRLDSAKRNPTVAQVAAISNSSKMSSNCGIALRAPSRFSRYGPSTLHLSRTPQCSSKSSEITRAPKPGFWLADKGISKRSILQSWRLASCVQPMRRAGFSFYLCGKFATASSSRSKNAFCTQRQTPQVLEAAVHQAMPTVLVCVRHGGEIGDVGAMCAETLPEEVRVHPELVFRVHA